MGATTPTAFEVFGVPFALEVGTSTLGQGGARAYPPVPEEDDEGRVPTLTLGTSGEQDAGVIVEVVTRRGGNVGDVAGSWRYSTDSATEFRGLDLPTSQQGVDLTLWTGSGIEGQFSAVTLPDQRVVCLYAYRGSAPVPWTVRCRVWSPTTGAWGASVGVQTGLSANYEPQPCVVLVPDGRLLVFYWNCDDTTESGQIDVKQSRDSGATWEYYARGIIPADTGAPFATNFGLPLSGGAAAWRATPNRIAVTIAQQQLVLYFGATGNVAYSGDSAVVLETMWQFASADYGATLTFIDHSTNNCRPVAVTVNGIPWLAWVGVDPTDATLYVQPLTVWTAAIGSSADRISVGVIGSATTGGGGVISLVWAEFGMYAESTSLWVPWMSAPGTTQVGQVYLINTLNEDTTLFAAWGYDGNAASTELLTDFCAVGYRRQCWVIGRMESATSTYENLQTVVWLGGNSSVTMPLDGAIVEDTQYSSYTSHYIPTALPTVYPWTTVGAGTQSIGTTAGWLTLVTVAQQRYYTWTVTSAAADGHLWLFRVRVVSGGIVSDSRIGISIRHAGVGYGYVGEVYLSGAQIRAYDYFGATILGTVTLAAGTWEIRVAVSSGKMSVHARVYTQGWDRQWEVVVNGGTLTDDGGTLATTNVVQWGNITAVGSNTSEWQMVYGTGSNDTASVFEAEGFTNPDDLRPAPYLSVPTYLAAGVFLTATGGLAATGDTYQCYPDAEYAQRFAMVRGSEDSLGYVQGGQRPSPTVETHSTAVASTSFPAYWRWQFVGDGNQYLPPVVLFQFVNLNTESVALRYHVSGGASVSIGTHNQTINSYGLKFLRSGPIVKVDTGSASTTNPYVEQGELIGGYAIDGANVACEIMDNTAGQFGNGGTAETPTLTLGTGYGSFAASGTMRVVPPVSTFVWFTDGTIQAAGFELYYGSAPYTAEGYVKLGALAICTGVVPFTQSNWGEERTEEEAAEVLESEWGVTFPRQAHTLRRVRGLQFDYPDYNGRLIQSGTTLGANSYFTATSSASYPIVATYGDTQSKLNGIFRGTQGGSVPIVHAGRVARGTPNTQSITLGQNVGLLGLVTALPTQRSEYMYEQGGTLTRAVKMSGAWVLRELR